MRTKFLAGLLAAGLLVGAGLVTSVISAPGTAQAREEIGEDDEVRPPAHPFGLFGEILDEFVEDGTITSDQADAIVGAARDKVAELKEQRRERLEDGRRHLHRNFRWGVRFGTLLDDGGIDEGEYGDLGENHPLKQVDVGRYFEDGLITPEELREILHDLKDAPFGDS